MHQRSFIRNASCVLALAATVTLSGCQSGTNIDGMMSAGSSLLGAATMTDEQMQQLGDQTIAQQDSQNHLVSKNSPYAQRLARLTQGWETVDGHTFDFNVYQIDNMNAFAVPNGSIRLHSGLMDGMTDDEVRYVLAHEIGHVVLGHSKKAFQVAYASSAAREAVAASGNDAAAAISSSQLGDLGEKLINSQFSQSQEKAADDYALELMQRSNMDASASISALRTLEANYGNSSSMFSSHPAPGDRADRMEEALQQ